ncbi:MAG TPA: MFS transporter [Methylomirabilota bacterium]|jgi:predicted MFS family arabinose efflux permease|nr:MFS transporter [Methylomirabilota bacterium]
MRFPSGLRALNHRDFRVFYAAQLVALTGSWMQTVAQAWLVLQLTDSPLRLGLIGTLQFSPVLVFALVAGAVVDRLPKRTVLIATQATLACQAVTIALLVWTGHAQYWHICVLATVLGFANVLDMPARQSFVVELVGRDDLVNGVALNSAAFNAARIVGPAVAGVLIARVGVAPAFALNSIGFLGVIGALLSMRARGLPRARAGTTMLEEISEGLVYAFRTPVIKVVLGVLLMVGLCVFNFTVYVPLFARHVLRLGAEGFGFLMASLGVGAVAGALTVGVRASRQAPLGLMFVSAAISFAGLLAMAAVRQPWLAAPVLCVIGFFGIVMVASANTALQLAAPDALRGRVMSLYALVYGGIYPIGAFLVGAYSEAWGVPAAFFINGVLGFVGLAALGAWWRHRLTWGPRHGPHTP